MLIVDASALLRALLPGAEPGLAQRLGQTRELHAPHLLDLEVVSALRRLLRREQIGEDRARDAITDLEALNVTRYPHQLLLPRIWEFRENLTAYDGAYVALAEALDAPLLTADGHLARSTGHRASIELIASS